MFKWLKPKNSEAAAAAAGNANLPIGGEAQSAVRENGVPRCLTVGELAGQLWKFPPGASATAECGACGGWCSVTGVEEINGWIIIRVDPR